MFSRLYILLAFYISTTIAAVAQKPQQCGHTAYKVLLEKKYNYNKSIEKLEQTIARKKLFRENILNSTSVVYNIPVVFHIIYNTESKNIPEKRILDQLNVINQDFKKLNKDTVNIPEIFKPLSGNMGFNFCLATLNPKGEVSNGINRIKTNQSVYNIDYDDEKIKSISYWPSDEYLNIWVAQLDDGILGYAQFPGETSLVDLSSPMVEKLDGVVIDVDAFGYKHNNSRYNLGRTLTHEIGHWLGLLHTFDDFGACGNDFVDDTPPLDSNNKELSPSLCEHYSYCSGFKSLDMSGNYMDYSPDACMNMFSLGQRGRMHAVMQSAPLRKKILSSFGCFTPPRITSLPFAENFESGVISPFDTLNLNSPLHWELVKYGADSYLKCVNNISTLMRKINYTFPHINFTTTKAPTLEFNIGCASINNELTMDSIVISHTPTPKLKYKITTLKGAQISCDETNNFTLSDTAGKTIKVNLSSLSTKFNTSILIEFYSHGNTNIYLDNIRIYENQNTHEIRLYPVPTRDVLTANILQDEQEDMTFEICNSLGKIIRTWNVKKEQKNELISTQNLGAGLYFIRTKFLQSNQIRVKKFTVE